MWLIHLLLQYYEKYIDLAQCLDQLGGKQELRHLNFLAYKAKQLGKKKTDAVIWLNFSGGSTYTNMQHDLDMMIGINTTHDISKLSQISQALMYNNF